MNGCVDGWVKDGWMNGMYCRGREKYRNFCNIIFYYVLGQFLNQTPIGLLKNALSLRQIAHSVVTSTFVIADRLTSYIFAALCASNY